MRRSTRDARRVATCLALLGLLLGLAAGLPACGGGGGDDGGGGGLNALMRGGYYVFALEGEEDPPGTYLVRSSYGSVTFDGIETVFGSLAYNENGVTGGPETVLEEYYIGTGGVISLEGSSGAFALGGISRDARVGVLGTRLDDERPQILAVARRGSGFSEASLSGGFHVVSWDFDGAKVHRGLAGMLNAAGGNATLEYDTVNENGMQELGFDDAVAYAVNANGSFTWNAAATPDFTGQLVASGEFGIAHATSMGPAHLALIRETAGASEATLDGEYFLVGFRYNSAGTGYTSETGRLYPNGAGGGSWSLTFNDSGMITGQGGPLTQYTVQGNGELSVTFDGIEAEGGVSADGRFAILGGGGSGPPYFAILVRNDFLGP